MGNPIVEIEFQVVDFPKLKEFYTALFGWEIDEPNEYDWAGINTRNSRGVQGAMVVVDELAPGPRGAFFYVEVDDLEECLRRAEQLGGKTVVPPWEEVGLAVFTDPEGNRVGLRRAAKRS